MTVQKYVSNVFSSMGTGGTSKTNSGKAITGVIFFTPDTVVAPSAGQTCLSTEDAATSSKKIISKEWWVSKIKSQNCFPFPTVVDYVDSSVAAKEYTYPSGRPKIVGEFIKVFEFKFDIALDTHRAMQMFNNKDLDFVLVESDGKIRFWNDGGSFRGFKAYNIQTMNMTEVPADAGSPAISGLKVSWLDANQWDKFGDQFYPEWAPSGLEPLIPTYLSAVQVAASKKLTVNVGTNGGYNSTTGTMNKIPILGLTTNHFLVTKAGVTQTINTFAAATDNSGNYELTINAALLADVFDITLQQIATDLSGDLLLDPVASTQVTMGAVA